MAASVSPSIDNLERTWRSIDDLCATFSEDEWKRGTGCPGWSVQDNVSHLIDYESRALGRPGLGDEKALSRPHTKNDLGEANEVGVEYRRSRSGREVLEEFRDVTAARLAQLQSLTTDDLEREMVTPAGAGTLADMLSLRVMDTWAHEQDIRRAVGKPGHDAGPAVDESITYWCQFLPIIVARRAEAPDGSVVVFEIGDRPPVAVATKERRGSTLESPPAEATVRLSMSTTTFAALVGGRSDVPDDVTIDGDTAVGERVVAALGFLP